MPREALSHPFPLPPRRDFPTKLISAWIHLAADITLRVRNFLGITHNRCTSNITLFLELLHFLARQLPRGGVRREQRQPARRPAYRSCAAGRLFITQTLILILILYTRGLARTYVTAVIVSRVSRVSAHKLLWPSHRRIIDSAYLVAVMDDFGRGTSDK